MASLASALITDTLCRVSSSEEGESTERLLALVYDKLRSLARGYLRRESSGHSMDASDLVHEAYLKLVDQSRVDWRSKTHFYWVGALAMRRILVDHAREKKRQKRGGEAVRVTLYDDVASEQERGVNVLAVDEMLRELERLNLRHAEIVEMRFFGGMTVNEVSNVLSVSEDTVKRDWRICKAWIRSRLAS